MRSCRSALSRTNCHSATLTQFPINQSLSLLRVLKLSGYSLQSTMRTPQQQSNSDPVSSSLSSSSSSHSESCFCSSFFLLLSLTVSNIFLSLFLTFPSHLFSSSPQLSPQPVISATFVTLLHSPSCTITHSLTSASSGLSLSLITGTRYCFALFFTYLFFSFYFSLFALFFTHHLTSSSPTERR